MSTPLAPIADPLALARLQVLVVPVHRDAASEPGQSPAGSPVLTDAVFAHWSALLRSHTMLRGDEVVHGAGGAGIRGAASGTPGPSAPSTPTSSVFGNRTQSPSKSGATHRRSTPTVTTDRRARFLPPATGASIGRAAAAHHVHLAFPTNPPAKHLYPLSLLRMSAFPLVVIGIAVDDGPPADPQTPGIQQTMAGSADRANPTTNYEEWSKTFANTLASFLPPTAAFPLVKRLVLVPSTLPGSNATPRSPARDTFSSRALAELGLGQICRAPPDGAENWAARLLGEIVGQVFGELGELASSLESPAGMKTLAGTLLPSLSATLPSPLTESPRQSPTTEDKPDKPRLPHSNSAPRLGSPAGLGIGIPSGRALTPGGRPASIQAPSAPPITTSAIAPTPSPQPSASSNPFRRSTTALTASFHRTPSGSGGPSSNSTTSARDHGMSKYTTAPLAGIAGGRLLKLLADMYLLAGLYSDAIRCYEDSAERCRVVGDVLWEALAREGRAVAGICEAWEGRDGSNHSTPFPTSPIAVEVLSHYLSSLACLSRSPLPFPPTILSPAPQAARDSVSFPASGGPTPQVGTGEGLLAYLYTTLCLRISHFVLLIFAAGGWGSIAVSALIAHALPRSFPPLIEGAARGDPTLPAARNRRLALARLSHQSQIARHTVVGHASAALGAFRRALTRAEQLAVVVEVVWLARWLEMERKEASATRDAVKLLALAVVEGREEHRRLAKRPSRPTHGAADSGDGNGNGNASPMQQIVGRRRESADGNSGVMELFERVANAFGIDLVAIDAGVQSVVQDGKEMEPPRFGWPDLQVEVMKEGIAVAEALPDHPNAVRLCLSALHSLHSHLTPANQLLLAKRYPAAMTTIRRRSLEFPGIPWWIPGRVVLSVEIAGLATNKMPFEHARAEITGAVQGKDPFLYNPRLKAPEAGKTVLVANEQVDVFVTLKNVFAFDLEIQDLSLLTSGAPFVTTPLPLVLPASSVQTVRVTGLAPAAGSLQIRGVNVRLMDGSSAEFLLPILDQAETQRDSKRRSRLLADAAKTKRQGLEARHSLYAPDVPPPTPQEEQLGQFRWLECTVVEEQPLLWIKKTSLSHGTIMLFNGEKSVIRITLENSSSVPVDFVKLSFDDSVSRDTQSLLSTAEDITPEQAYELDQDTTNRPVFSWDSGSGFTIPPGGRATLAVQVLGKVGCTDGSIRIDYGYINRTSTGATGNADAPSSSPQSPTSPTSPASPTSPTAPGLFHTRRITFPVLFTVYHTLEAYGLDLVSLRGGHPDLANGTPTPAAIDTPTKGAAVSPLAASPSSTPGTPPTSSSSPARSTGFVNTDAELQRALARADGNTVLVTLNVRNIYSVPFEVAIAAGDLAVTRLVPPGATERLAIPVARQPLSAADRARPIPSTGRQYVVAKNKQTEAEAARARALFWARERLLSLVAVRWREPSSLRAGSLSLRDLVLSPAQAECLWQDRLDVALRVAPRDGADGDAFQAMDFVDLTITVANHLERPLRPFVRLEALPTSSTDGTWSVPAGAAPRRVSSLPTAPVPLPRTLAFDGVLAATLPLLAPGEAASHVVGAALLASGSYSFRAAVEEVAAAPALPPTVCFSAPVCVDVV